MKIIVFQTIWMNKNRFVDWFKGRLHIYLIAFMAIGLLLYTGYRSYKLSFTHDESYCYTRYVTQSFGDIVSYAHPTANNHILNTLLMKYFSILLQPSEFVLRLPNFLAHLFFIIFSFLILRRIKNNYLMLIGFIILNFNPYLLEFFSLARGYGLSTSLMLISIYYLIIFLDKKEQRQLSLSMIFAMLALYSNFVLIHYFISLIAIFNLLFLLNFYETQKNWKGFLKHVWKKNIPILIVLVVAVFISYEPIRKLVKFNELYGRGENGFWLDTVLSFVFGSMYGANYHFDLVKLFMLLTMVMIAVAAVILFIDFKKHRFNPSKSKGIIFLLLLILPALSTIFQHQLAGSQYLIYRTTLFFHPLLGLTLIYLVYYTIQNQIIKYAAYPLSLIIALAMLFHTINAANLEFASEWKYDAGTKEMINDLEHAYVIDALTNRTTPAHVKLGINWLFEPTVNYYRISKKLKWLVEVDRNGPVGDYNYYYVFTDDTTALNVKKVINSYKISNSLLAK